jgi:SAM-dependent methyltransferase
MIGWLLNRASRLCASLSDVFLYAAAAFTPLDALREGVRRHWEPFELSDDFATKLFPWELLAAERFVRKGERVLVVGCGSGRDVIPLLERGCIVTGVDPAQDALVRARRRLAERGYAPTLECAFFEEWQSDATFDVCWFSWFTYGYIPDSRRRIDVLRKAARHLAPEGRVVISYVSERVVSRAATLGRRIGRMGWSRDWRLEEGDVLFRVPGTGAVTFEHRFTLEEIESEADAAAFHPVYVADPIVVLMPNTSPTIAR